MDTSLDFEINKLESYFDNLENALNNISEDNFEKCIKRINANVNKIFETRSELIQNNSSEILRRRSQSMEDRVKLILQKFDNIIEKNKTEQVKVKNDLGKLLNKKKLIHYK